MAGIYRKTETDYLNGTINLRTYLRKYMSAERVNRVLVDLNAYPYHRFVALETNQYGLDLELDIFPASGQFRIRRNYW